MQNAMIPFSSCLEKILNRRQITVTTLTRMLAYKSKTTLTRILQNQSGLHSVRNVCADLIACKELALTEEEVRALERAVWIGEHGSENYLAYQEMWRLLKAQYPEYTPLTVINRTDIPSLSFLLEQLAGTRVECTILNCCYPAVAADFVRLLTAAPKKTSIRHYIQFGSESFRAVHTMGIILPLLVHDSYLAYSIPPVSGGPDASANVITIKSTNSKTTVEYELLLCGGSQAILTSGRGSTEKWRRFIASYPVNPIKSVKDVRADSLSDLMNRYRKLEENTAIYKLKPDLCLGNIRENIVRAAFEDRYRSAGLPIPHEALDSMTAIHKHRFDNYYRKKKPTHLVVSESSMRAFANTGRLSDHPCFMRSYSILERIEILSFCINQLKTNPCFRIHLLTPEAEKLLRRENPIQIICYEGSCVHILPAITDFNLKRGHSEIFIQDPAFVRLCADFFRSDLIENHTRPEADTVTFLMSLLTMLTRRLEEAPAAQPQP